MMVSCLTIYSLVLYTPYQLKKTCVTLIGVA